MEIENDILTPEAEEINLETLLAQQTAKKLDVELPPPPATGPDPAAETLETTEEPVFDQQIVNEINSETGDQQKINPEFIFDGTKLAPVIVDFADQVIQSVFPDLYLKTLSKEDVTALKLLATKVKAAKFQQPTTYQEGELKVMEIFSDFEEYKKSLPFEPSEKKQLIIPLQELLKNVDYKTTPGNALIIAVLLVMFGRIYPLAKNKFL